MIVIECSKTSGIMKKLPLLAVVTMFFISCGSGASHNMTADEAAGYVSTPQAVEAESVEFPVGDGGAADCRAVSPEKKIIREGRMGIRVDDLAQSKASLDSSVARYGAYYGNESFNDYHATREYDLTIRIPAGNYERFIAAVESGGGEVTYKSIDTRDVSEQYYDLETRLANKRSYLERYRELLKRAATIKDILEVESHIRVLEEEIESTEGRLRLMGNQVEYSTLRLNIVQEKDEIPLLRNGFGKRLGNAFSAGWSGFVSFVVALFYIWPLWLILITGGVIVFCRVRKRRKTLRG